MCAPHPLGGHTLERRARSRPKLNTLGNRGLLRSLALPEWLKTTSLVDTEESMVDQAEGKIEYLESEPYPAKTHRGTSPRGPIWLITHSVYHSPASGWILRMTMAAPGARLESIGTCCPPDAASRLRRFLVACNIDWKSGRGYRTSFRRARMIYAFFLRSRYYNNSRKLFQPGNRRLLAPK